MDLKNQLNANGYAIIPNVISPEKVEIAKKFGIDPNKIEMYGKYKVSMKQHQKHVIGDLYTNNKMRQNKL